MAVAVTDNAAETLTASLLEQKFWQSDTDGYWYPTDRTKSRARIRIDGGMYVIQTRRSLDQPWTLLVRALVSDFDPVTFARWAEDWPLRLP